MTEVERAEFVLGFSAAIRDGMNTSISMVTRDEDEKEQVAGAVLACLVKEMYRARGTKWLEKMIAMVLK